MATIATLTVDLIAESARFRSELQKANNDAKSWSVDVRNAVNEVAVGFAAVGTATAAALAAAVVSTADYANEVANLSKLSNTTSEDFQRQAAGAKLHRIEMDKLADIYKDTNDKIGDFVATGGGAALDFFENIAPQVGVTADSFRNLSGPDALQLYYNSLEKANVSQQQMTFYMEAIASDATALVPLLRDNGAGFKEAADQADRLGLVLSDIQVETLREADVAISQAKDGLGALVKQIGAQFAPVATDLARRFLAMAEEAGGFGAIAGEVFDYTIEAAGYVANALRGIEVVFLALKAGASGFVEGALLAFEKLEEGARAIANLFPGVEVSAETFIGNIRQSFSNVTADTLAELEKLAQTPLPHDSIVQWTKDVTSAATAAAAEVAQQNSEVIANQAAETVTKQATDAAAKAAEESAKAVASQLEKLKSDFSSVQTAGLTDSEAENERFRRQIETLEAAEAAKIESIKPYHELREKLTRDHEKRLSEIEKSEMDYRAKFQAMSLKDQGKEMFSTLASFTQSAAQHNKTMFRANQVAGIANATIATYDGAAQALKWGWPLGPIFAGIIVAAGLANVKAIASMQYGAGGGSAPSSVTAGGGPANPGVNYTANLPSVAANDVEPSRAGSTINIYGQVNSNHAETFLRDLEQVASERDYVVHINVGAR